MDVYIPMNSKYMYVQYTVCVQIFVGLHFHEFRKSTGVYKNENAKNLYAYGTWQAPWTTVVRCTWITCISRQDHHGHCTCVLGVLVVCGSATVKPSELCTCRYTQHCEYTGHTYDDSTHVNENNIHTHVVGIQRYRYAWRYFSKSIYHHEYPQDEIRR